MRTESADEVLRSGVGENQTLSRQTLSPVLSLHRSCVLAVLVQGEVGTHWVRSGVVGGGSLLCKGHWELGVWQAEEQSSIRLATLSTEWSLEYLLGKD